MPRKKQETFNFIERPSPNFNERNGAKPTFLILHYTAMATAESALERLSSLDPPRVSSHYLIGKQGAMYNLVTEDKRAWHAGASYWNGLIDLNTHSIGIEIDNDGQSPFPQAQMDAVVSLSKSIIRRHKIRARNVLGHSDIAPMRKQDPGHFFDWKGLAAERIGIWPAPLERDYARAKRMSLRDIREALTRFGYSPEPDLQTLITTFQRHFHPEVFADPQAVGIADGETMARLACLVRRKR